jgi:hypothetical protein
MRPMDRGALCVWQRARRAGIAGLAGRVNRGEWSISFVLFVLMRGPEAYQKKNQSNETNETNQKTARSCVGYRSCHPNRVMSGNPSVALADCPAPHSSYWLASYGRAYWHRALIARPLNHHPATEAGAAPFARWLHKSGSNLNEAANLSKRSTSLSCQIIMLTSKSTRP